LSLLLRLLTIGCCASTLLAGETNWPQFRGPRGDGTATASSLPLTWDETNNVRWKTPVHGKAWSSPVIWDQQIWLTTATEDGKRLFAVCADRETGKTLFDLKLFEVEKPQYAHPFNSYASPTPVVEDGRVYVTFGSPGTACLDTHTGKVLWSRRDFECNHYRGAGSSPILYDGLFILNFDGSDHQFIVALDKATGKTIWQKNRSIDFQDLEPNGEPKAEGDLRKAFATCQIVSLEGHATLLSQGSKAFYAYEPLTGDELWRLEDRGSYSGSTRPVAGRGLIFFPTGFSVGQLLAIRPGKKGEVLDINAAPASATQLQVAWKAKKNAPKKPSLTLVGNELYAIDDNGVATCWDAESGAVIWNERIGGNYSASMLAAPGRLYFFSEEGKITIISTGREFKKLSENHLPGGFMASPAVSGNALFLRTRTDLYRLEQEAPAK
jgi:outer membrane protein assembly factor BamB